MTPFSAEATPPRLELHARNLGAGAGPVLARILADSDPFRSQPSTGVAAPSGDTALGGNLCDFFRYCPFRFPIEGLCIIFACVSALWLWDKLGGMYAASI